MLWHYTSLDALKNIVESKKIWASDIRFLNDSEEYKHAVDLLKQEAQGIVDADMKEFVLEGVHSLFSTGVLSPDKTPVFVTSFSIARDALSQWRAYTAPSKGVSLGFDLRALRPDPKTDKAVTLAPCIYGEQQKRQLIRSALQVLFGTREEIEAKFNAKGASLLVQHGHLPDHEWEQIQNTELEAEGRRLSLQLKQTANRILLDLIPIMPLLKHPSFEEEHEWRLVIHADPEKLARSTDKMIRVGKSSFIPYVAYDLPIGVQTNRPALTQVLMGPNPNMERSILATKTFLEWNGFNSIQPQPSATSFRSW